MSSSWGLWGTRLLWTPIASASRLAVGLACRLMGGVLCSASSFASEKPQGIQCLSCWRKAGRAVAVTAEFEERHKGVGAVLAAAAALPGSKLAICSTCDIREQVWKFSAAGRTRPWKRFCFGTVVGEDGDEHGTQIRTTASRVAQEPSGLFSFFGKAFPSAPPPGEWPRLRSD